MGEKMTHPSLTAEDLARRIRVQLAEFNNDDLPVEALVRVLVECRRAHLAQPAQAVDVGAIERSDVWVVQDEAGHPIHCAGWPQACREHIREAINEHGIEEARAWKVLHYTNGATA